MVSLNVPLYPEHGVSQSLVYAFTYQPSGFCNQSIFVAIFVWLLTPSLKAHKSLWLYICPAVPGSDRFSDTTALNHYWRKELSLPDPGSTFSHWAQTGQSPSLWSLEWVLPGCLNCLRLSSWLLLCSSEGVFVLQKDQKKKKRPTKTLNGLTAAVGSTSNTFFSCVTLLNSTFHTHIYVYVHTYVFMYNLSSPHMTFTQNQSSDIWLFFIFCPLLFLM